MAIPQLEPQGDGDVVHPAVVAVPMAAEHFIDGLHRKALFLRPLADRDAAIVDPLPGGAQAFFGES